ncbi:MAG: glycine C-acetyltransferase [Elusimicrobiaceae bacterium]|nr:glycine C-acetyltransferase [Elusimicrobiaceae bacterium]
MATVSKSDRLDFLKDEVRQLQAEHRLIVPRVLESAQDAVSVIDGRKVINLTSNNYLCLTTHPKVKKAAVEATEKYGVGTAAVRSIIGTMCIHEELEARLAEFKGTEAALMLQSGFSTNVAVCQSLMTSPDDLLVSDELNHASIIDGARLAKSARKIYKHSDMASLEQILQSPEARKARRKLLVTDGVFSMDGDIAKLPEIVELCEKYGVTLMVDDAHSSGVLGRQGRGTVDHFNLKGRVDIQIGTLSKAFASIGGYAAGTKELRQYLISTARPFLFSSSHPPSVVATCSAGLDVLYNEPQRLQRLWENSRQFKEGLKKAGFDTGRSETPITPVMVGDTVKAQQFSSMLFEEGVFALSIGFPTVSKGKERLRTIVTAGHTQQDLETAVGKFAKVGRQLGII